jgi:hypothetical protein
MATPNEVNATQEVAYPGGAEPPIMDELLFAARFKARGLDCTYTPASIGPVIEMFKTNLHGVGYDRTQYMGIVHTAEPVDHKPYGATTDTYRLGISQCGMHRVILDDIRLITEPGNALLDFHSYRRQHGTVLLQDGSRRELCSVSLNNIHTAHSVWDNRTLYAAPLDWIVDNPLLSGHAVCVTDLPWFTGESAGWMYLGRSDAVDMVATPVNQVRGTQRATAVRGTLIRP